MIIRPTRPVDSALEAQYAAAGLWRGQRLRDGLEHWAKHTATRPAVIDNERTLTYGELEATVAVAVARLRNAGIHSGSAVLALTPVAVEAVVAYLAVVRTGATIVLLDRRCGRADVDNATGAIGFDLVLADAGLRTALALDDLNARVMLLDDLLADGAADRGWPEPDPGRPGAMFFTSGTTSRPKAVVHSLDTLRSGARNMADTLALTETDAAFLSSPVASITGIMQVHLTLDRGAALVLEDRFAPESSLHRVRQHGATILGGAPIIAEELLREAKRQGVDELPIRAMALGGAMIPRDLLELATDRWGIVPSRVYGSSEAPMATYTLPSDHGVARLADDGALAPGTEIRIDPATGEVLLRGPMLFLGYLHDEDNAAMFTDDGWLRTGDLGQLDERRITVTGRLKEVAVRKGLKISLPEVDEAARTIGGVKEAAAYAVVDPDTGERTALAVRMEPGQRPPAFDDITSALLASGLAKWKLPEEVALWDTPLPRTETGKVRRHQLGSGAQPRLFASRLRRTR